MIYLNRFISSLLTPFTWIFGVLRRIIPGLKRLPTLSAEWLAFVLTLIFLITLIIISLIFWLSSDVSANKHNYPWLELTLGAIIIPILMFWFVRLLLAPPKSPFPDIDAAWNASMAELSKNGISIKSVPVFLILGVGDSSKARQLMEATERSFDCKHVTADGQALHCYGGSEAVYFVMTGVGNVSMSTRELAAYQPKTSQTDEYQSNDAIKNTIGVGILGDSGAPPAPVEEYADLETSKQTLKPEDIVGGGSPSPSRPSRAASNEPRRQQAPVTAREKVSEQNERLQHVCRLLKRVRNPVSSLNGVLVSAPNWLVETFPDELSRQIRSDLDAICQTTGVISTATFAVSGFESEPGCREFVSRLTEKHGEDFYQRRFGKSYRSWAHPTTNQLEEISHETVESFDQFTYSLFTQRDALSAKHVLGNRELVKFLCRAYEKFYPGLKSVLSNGFGTGAKAQEDFPRFNGCYFMGVGGDSANQFFVKGVFERMDENMGELEWNQSVKNQDEAWSLMSNIVFLIGLASFAVFFTLMFFDYLPQQFQDLFQSSS